MSEEYSIELGIELNEQSLQEAENKIRNIGKNKVNINVDSSKAKDAEKNVKALDSSLKSTTKTSRSFGDSIKRALGFGSAAAVVVQGFRLIRKSVKESIESVKEINKAITNLRIVTNESRDTVKNWIGEYNGMARSLGATTTQIADSATTWMRQGKSVSETNTLIRDSTILAKNGMIDTSSAAQYLTTSMKGYKLSVEDAIDIVDKLSKLDSSAAVTAGELAEGMSNVAQMANDMGVSMDTLLGQLSSVGEVVGDVGKVGTALKTIYSRMSDIKSGKLELIDEDGTSEILSDVEQTLANVGIDLRKTVTEYNNYSDVLDNLADKWDSLSQVQQNALAKAFAGTRQQNVFRTLMANYNNVRKYTDLSANSKGAAEEKFNNYLDSIEAKTNTLQAAFESLATNNFSDESYKGIIEATTALVTFIDKVKILKGTLAGLIAGGVLKGFASIATGITSASMKLNEFNAALDIVKTGNIGKDELTQLTLLTANLSKSQLKAVLSSQALTTEQRIAILTANGMSASEAKATIATMGLATAEGTATETTNTFSGALKGLVATLKANPIMMIATIVSVVTTVVSVATQAFRDYQQSIEEAKQAVSEKITEIEDEKSQVEQLISQYKELSTAEKTDSDTREKIKNIQDEITKLVGSQADNLDLVNGKLDEELNKLKNISSEQTSQSIATYRENYNNKKDDVNNSSVMHNGFWLDNLMPWKGEDYLIAYTYFPSEQELYNSVVNVFKDVMNNYGNTWYDYGSFGFKFNDDTSTKGKIQALSDILEQLQNLDGYDTDTELFSMLTVFRDELQNTYNTQIEAGKQLLEALIVDYDNNNRGEVKSYEQYLKFRKKIINNIGKDSTVAQMIEEGVLDPDSLESTVDNYLSTLNDFSDYYNQWYQNVGSEQAKAIERIQLNFGKNQSFKGNPKAVSYTHLRAHET